MNVHNHLPLLLDCLRRWTERPRREQFLAEYFDPISKLVGVIFEDRGRDFYGVLEDLNWKTYRDEALTLDPPAEEARLRAHIASVEALFGFKLEGEAVLFGAFTCMDGYARFDRGSHRVFLGVDESHGRGRYLDVLLTHELTHVARESRPEVWRGWGLDPAMTHDQFTETQPVIEHLVGEGFSCAVSERLVPDEDPWTYAYQTEDGLARILAHGPAYDRAIHAEIRKSNEDGDYGRLYNPKLYAPGMPPLGHYAWAWQWVKSLLARRAGGDPRKLVAVCSKELIEDALAFRLEKIG
jgi:hypothetical protein